MALKEPRTITMEIDHREMSFPEGVSVLRAAELNDIYIPSLCSHKDLSPFGGCRMCMVEIEGMRGYPLACNTIAQAGMKVLTDTVMLRELRKEILKLILSEHPSSCLVCEEKEECKDYQGTIRKTGVTTGCRFCPNDGQCELQDVVEAVGITEIDYPIYYHGYEPEHDDPFYDRDYNICILCGRCVRMCQEVRGTGVLAFTYRGPKAKIGPAFGRSHIEAGCEFCGACVDVCPTGALADKASKWDGKPDGMYVSTCPFCAIGCQVELSYKNGRLSKASANLDPEINDGQLCVRGRFCMPEVTHHYERARRPMIMKDKYFREVSWDEALEKVAGKLRSIRPRDFLMLVSPDLTNESLFAARKFVRSCLGSNGIDSTARTLLGGGLGLWSKLFGLPISIKNIAKADRILAIGLDSRFDFSVVGVKVRKALDKGAKLVTIDARDSNLARYTDYWLQLTPGMEGYLLKTIADSMMGKKVSLSSAAKRAGVESKLLSTAVEVLHSGEDLAVIIGPQIFHYVDIKSLVDGLLTLSERKRTSFIPLYFGANARGTLEIGVFPELEGNGGTNGGKGISLADIINGKFKPKVLYLVGETPFQERPDCDFLIVQDIYKSPFEVDVFLPASSFAEAGGTLVNVEGRVQEVIQVENSPEGAVTGFMRPDWRIFSDLAKALGNDELKYKKSRDVLKEISKTIPGFPNKPNRKPRRLTLVNPPKDGKRSNGGMGDGKFLLVAEPAGYRHRGIDISRVVGGLGELALEQGFRMHPEDIAAFGADGDHLTVIAGDGAAKATTFAKADPECPRGVIYFTQPTAFGGLTHGDDMRSLYELSQNPVRVNITAEKKTRKK
jgi:formate dehydrogenase alpha subunit